ncbi:hypothetical protein ILUMI_12790 [Ignelater luminosus]|uniref:Uncharacterized protein n=1 Tax=Ignelater luminosus TaxID=2038154 RepID=A0A8K0CXU5_IGNLU|nr:hypothetical protein ILUMI_12790 [Ignelater luminosus]
MKKTLMLWLFLTLVEITIQQRFKLPEVTLEALKTGEVRVYIPNRDGIKKFSFHANVQTEIVRSEPGQYKNETKAGDDFWVLTFNVPNLSKDQNISYWYSVIANRVVYVTDGGWTVEELKDFYEPLKDPECKTSVTVVSGGQSSCIGWPILDDNFNGPTVDTSKWFIHHKIPTYSPPNFEFNSYLNQDDTRFFKDGVLYLKPIPFTDDREVRGVLNLTDKCTSSNPKECLYIHKSSFLLPPVKSAKITSKLSFKYGKIEIKAKLPSGDWIVPIIELEDRTETDGESFPKVWIAYSRGNKLLKSEGPDDLGSHWLYSGPVINSMEPTRSKFLKSKHGENPFSNDFHIYKLEWIPGKMIFYVDNEVYGDISTETGFAEFSMDVRSDWTKPEAPYNREYVLSLGVAVGGLFDFPDGYNSDNDIKPWENSDRHYISRFFSGRNAWMKTWHGDDVALQVDYVRITAL